MPCSSPRPLATTTDPVAASIHRSGVAELLAGRPAGAVSAFTDALRRDPGFALALADLALAKAELGAADRGAVRADAEGLALVEQAERRVFAARRWERHHVEVLQLALRGRCDRAIALGREHLLEFPHDGVVGHVLERCCCREGERLAGRDRGGG